MNWEFRVIREREYSQDKKYQNVYVFAEYVAVSKLYLMNILGLIGEQTFWMGLSLKHTYVVNKRPSNVKQDKIHITRTRILIHIGITIIASWVHPVIGTVLLKLTVAIAVFTDCVHTILLLPGDVILFTAYTRREMCPYMFLQYI